jgi:hypothetical protein
MKLPVIKKTKPNKSEISDVSQKSFSKRIYLKENSIYSNSTDYKS